MQTRPVMITEDDLEYILKALRMLEKHHKRAIKSCEYMGQNFMKVSSMEKRDGHVYHAERCSDLEATIAAEFS